MGAREKPRRVHQLVDVVHLDHAKLAEHRTVDLGRAGQGSGVRLGCPLAVFGFTHLQRDHRLAMGCSTLNGGNEPRTVLDTFKQRDDDLDVGGIRHVVNEIRHLQVHLVACGSPQADADTSVHRLHHVAPKTATLRGKPDRALHQIVRE